MGKIDFSIKDAIRNCPELPILIYLFENGPSGVRAMLDDGVASQGGISRAVRDMILAGLVEYDTSHQIPGRPLRLTARGMGIAPHLKAVENYLQEHPFP